MKINLAVLNHTFTSKPLVVGGRAKEYYGIRRSGVDIDLVVTEEDYIKLSKKYPNNTKDLWGDFGVCVKEFEIWRTIMQFDYKSLIEGAVEKEEYYIVSVEKLLLLTAVGMEKDKYKKDLELIVEYIKEKQYEDFDSSKYENVAK